MKSKSNILLLAGVLISFLPFAVQAKDTYPKLANYYLRYYTNVHSEDTAELKKWDLIILQNDIGLSHPGFIAEYKRAKPDGIVLAYVLSAMAVPVPQGIYNRIDAANLWLRGGNGQKLEIWPNVFAANLTKDALQSMSIDYVESRMKESPWDGVMYDTVDATIDHYSRTGIDIDGNGVVDPANVVNSAWQRGMASLFAKTRQRLPGKIILMNGNSIDSYQPNTNGRIFENFPTPWEGNGSWQASMYQYLRRLPGLNRIPVTYVINSTTRNTGRMTDYRTMRFGLTSALLGDGYFSFDFGDQAHEQLWWYDEYDLNLGRAESSYYNLLEPNNDYVKAGLWRRDFENGISIVNSTAKEQLYVFNREEFEKIKGKQDPGVNNGAKVNYIRLAPNDGIIMRTVRQDVVGQPFSNGDFLRVFGRSGQQLRNGFFAYKADATPGTRLLITDLDGNGQNDRITEKGGKLIVSGPGRKAITIAPFGDAFKGRISFAAYDFNKDGAKEIVASAASGGGPQVSIFSQAGKKLSPGFFAFDKAFRGGVMIAVGDIDRDGKGEIIAAPASGMGPSVKIFNEQGKLFGSFLAYDKNYRGGINMTVGDIDKDGRNEIITGTNAGGPHVRIFSSAGLLLGQFMAFDQNGRTGVRVTAADIDGDGQAEILAGTANF